MPQVNPNYPIIQPMVPYSPPNTPRFAQQSHDILANALPGLDKNTAGASSMVGELLGGMPSPSRARKANAYFGVASGMPGSDFVRNRGFDLYSKEADAYKQRGFDDFLNLLKGVSGTIAPTTGEQTALQQTAVNRDQRTSELNSDIAARNSQAEEMRRRQASLDWNANRNQNSFRTVDSLGMTPLFGWGSGR